MKVLYALLFLGTVSLSYGHFHLRNAVRNLESRGFRRSTQGVPPTKIKLCAIEYGVDSHLLVQVDKDNKATLKWIPTADPFCADIDWEEGTLRLHGDLIAKGQDPTKILQVDFLFKTKHDYEECFCFDEYGTNYAKIQSDCSKKFDPTKTSLLYCPKCEGDQCSIAAGNGAPNPIFEGWDFFELAEGQLTGPGLELYRQQLKSDWKLPLDRDCTIDILNLPLPQMYCTDYENPELGFGYGANAKDQDCGFSTWFRCLEDRADLGGGMAKTHTADINLDLITCPPSDKDCTVEPCCTIYECNEHAQLTDLVQNNLGGVGPDAGTQEIRFEDVFPVNAPGTSLTCVLNPSGVPYAPIDITKNGVRTKLGVPSTTIGQIAIRTPSLVNLTCTFSGDNADYFLTVMDIDQGERGNIYPEALLTCENLAFPFPGANVQTSFPDGCLLVQSTASGIKTTNPFEITDLTPEQEAVSVRVLMKNLNDITFQYTVGSAPFIPQTKEELKCCERNFFYSFCRGVRRLERLDEEECLAQGGDFSRE